MTGTYASPTKKQVGKALAELRALARRTPLEEARERFFKAKAAWNAAATAVHRQAEGAAQQADEALIELNAARQALREAGAA